MSMSPHARAPSPARRPNFLLRLAYPALVPALALGAFLLPGGFLGGCAPGTSTDAGNPELVIGFRQGGKPVDFEGVVHIYAADSNPAFYSPSPVDTRPPVEFIGVQDWDRYGTNAISLNTSTPVKRLDRRFLDEAAGYRVVLPLLPAHMHGQFPYQIAVRPGVEGLHFSRRFNILLDHEDSTSSLVEGITINALRTGYLAADDSPFDTLWVDLDRGVGITGTIDTAGLPDPPLILFMPGTPLAASVRGNRFHLPRAPRIKFPVRMVTRSGLVYAMRDSLDGTRSEAFYSDSVLALVPGERQDSMDLPDIPPFPAAPVANPAGPRMFSDPLLVTLTAEAGAVIFYTLNGEEPGLASERYTAPVRLKSSTNLKAVAYKQGQLLGPVTANQYIKVPPSPKAAPAGQSFRDSILVTLTTSAPEGVILYTLDGSAPHDSSPAYTRPLVIKSSATLKAVTFVEGSLPSQPMEEKYLLLPDSLAPP